VPHASCLMLRPFRLEGPDVDILCRQERGRSMKRVMLMVVGLGLLVGGQVRAGNLIVNGGFETGDFSGWNANVEASFVVLPSGQNGIPSHSGNYYVNFGTYTDAPGILSQTVSDMSGSNYTLAMWLLGDGGVNEFKVQWDGTTIYDMSIPDTLHTPTPYYIQLSFTVQGTGSDTVTLYGGDNGDNPGAITLDDVSLVPAASAVPEPTSLALLGMGILGVAGYVCRRRNSRVGKTACRCSIPALGTT
jgi:hypothetical protein